MMQYLLLALFIGCVYGVIYCLMHELYGAVVLNVVIGLLALAGVTYKAYLTSMKNKKDLENKKDKPADEDK